MNEEELISIEKRMTEICHHYSEDVPKLIAEVRRLNKALINWQEAAIESSRELDEFLRKRQEELKR